MALTVLFLALLGGLTAAIPVPCQDSLAPRDVPEAVPYPQRIYPVNDAYCDHRCDGLYSLGCVEEFISCWNGQTSLMKCPEGLVLDARLMHCIAPVDATVCEDVLPSSVASDVPSPSTKMPTAASSVAVVETEVPSTVIPSPTKTVMPEVALVQEFACVGVPDGLYPQGCSSSFVACVGDRRITMMCPSGLKFDMPSLQCLPQESVDVCGGSPSSTSMPETSTMKVEMASTTSADVPSELPQSEDSLLCEGQPNGVRTLEKCSARAVGCAMNRIVFFVNCPSTKKFDVETMSCQDESFIRSCGGSPTSFPEAAETVATSSNGDTSTVATESTSKPEGSGGQFLLDAFCEGVSEGNHAIGCASEFVACVDSLGTLMHCPSELVYEPSTHECLLPELAPVCGGIRQSTTVSVPTENADVALASDRPDAPSLPSGFSCESVADGMYDMGCSSNFIACVAGNSVGMKCPFSLRFDVLTQRCLAPTEVQACTTATISAEMPEKSATREAVEVSAQMIEVSSTPFAEESSGLDAESSIFDKNETISALCEAGFGTHSMGCSFEYTVCIFGRAIVRECPSKLLRFDDATHHCLPQEYVNKCGETMHNWGLPYGGGGLFGEKHIGDDVYEVSVSARAEGSGEPVELRSLQGSGEPIEADSDPVVPSCRGLSDGLYAEDCSDVFMSCMTGSGLLLHCPPNEKFDTERAVCALPETVAACAISPSQSWLPNTLRAEALSSGTDPVTDVPVLTLHIG